MKVSCRLASVVSDYVKQTPEDCKNKSRNRLFFVSAYITVVDCEIELVVVMKIEKK